MHVSVIIPLCKLQPDLQKTQDVLVRALRNLSLNFEILICDDTASSQSHVICKLIKDRDTYVKTFLHKRMLGLGCCIRELFAEARGDIILYIDPRISFDCHALPIFLNSMRQCDVAVASHYKAKEGEVLSIGFGDRLYFSFCRFLLRVPVCEVIPDLMVLRRKVIVSLPLKATGEDIFPEFFAQAHRQGFFVKEMASGFLPQKRNGFSRLFAALNLWKKLIHLRH